MDMYDAGFIYEVSLIYEASIVCEAGLIYAPLTLDAAQVPFCMPLAQVPPCSSATLGLETRSTLRTGRFPTQSIPHTQSSGLLEIAKAARRRSTQPLFGRISFRPCTEADRATRALQRRRGHRTACRSLKGGVCGHLPQGSCRNLANGH